jgi:sialate O-acetylesterase
MFRRLPLTAVLLVAIACSAAKAQDLKLPAVFGDHMVLQCDKPIAVWGWAKPGERVAVTLNVPDPKTHGVKAVATGTSADEDGKWSVTLFAQDANAAACTLIVTCGADTLTFTDILIGEVWLCSGQSNMQMSVRSSNNSAEEIAAADHPTIRLFSVPRVVAVDPQNDVNATWVLCSPQTVPNFSAVGYFFGRMLNEDLGVPVGLIHSSWGGTPAESWTTIQSLRDDEMLSPIAARYDSAVAEAAKPRTSAEQAKAEYVKKHEEAGFKLTSSNMLIDPGDEGSAKGWATAGFDDSQWKTMGLPSTWEQRGLNIDGSVWFRKQIEIPAAWAGKDLTLSLGPIDDFDVTYFNGQKVGSVGEDVANFWQAPRRYTVPGNMVAAGEATIAVRVFDHFGGGGIYGEARQMFITPANDADAKPISLTGAWLYQVERGIDTGIRKAPADGDPTKSAWLPSGLYNAMIHPLVPLTMRGAIWYQGESNAGRAFQYRTLLPTMIADWRKAFANDDLAFGIVQLANFQTEQADANNTSGWAELREAQTMTAAQPHNGMAVIIDIGDAKDIHPKNKQDVGKRLALWAEHDVYGKDVVYSGPMYKAMKIEGAKIRLSFDHIGGGLLAKGDKLTGFAIAGDDQQFVWADAVIDGDTIVVSSPDVTSPVAVRYGWGNNPPCNLYNKADLPASPFRTDDWPGVTVNAR